MEWISAIFQFVQSVVSSVTEGELKNAADRKKAEITNNLSEQYRKQIQNYTSKLEGAYYDYGKQQIDSQAKSKLLTGNLTTLAYVVIIVLFFVFALALARNSK